MPRENQMMCFCFFFLCAGVSRWAPVDSSESSCELEVWAQQHWPENRLQIQRRGHDDADGPQQRPVPCSHRRRGFKAPGRPASCRMVWPSLCNNYLALLLRQRNVQNLRLSLLWLFSLCAAATPLGMQSSKESSGRFLISHRNLKTEVCTVW